MVAKPKVANKRPPFAIPDIIDPAYRRCIKVFVPDDEQHLSIFAGLLRQLTDWQRWERDTLKRGTQVAQVWRDVFYQIDWTGQDCNNCEEGCLEYTPEAPFIEWFPNNPFTEPDLIGEGYNAPAWYKSTLASEIALGTQPGDVVTDLTRFPPGSLPTVLPASGLPRFRINLIQPGLVRLHLLNLFGGSLAQITIDDNLSTIRFIDLDRDQIAVPFETSTTTIEEVEVLGAGAHHIDIIIVSQLNDQIPFLHHGGGLRKVEICNGGVEMPYYELRQNPADNCLIEQRQNPNSEWIEAFRMDNCCCDQPIEYTRYSDAGIKEVSPDGVIWTEDREHDPRFYPPTTPPLPTAPGDTLRCESANNVTGWLHYIANDWIAKASLGSGVSYVLSILVPLFILIVTGITLGAATPLLLALAGALAATGSAAFDSAMTALVYDALNCILYCNTPTDGIYTEANWQAIKGAIRAEFTGIAETFLHDQINAMGIAGLNNAARTGVSEGLSCAACECTECVDVAHILVGTLVAVTESYIDIEAVQTTYNGLNKFWAVYGSESADFCCSYCEYGMVSGAISSGGLIDCDGNAYPTGAPNPIRRVQFYHDTTVFVIRYHFNVGGGCP